jgi:predicted O-methyltransferase YrrM
LLSQEMIQYLQALIPAREAAVQEMEAYAREHNVPIMDAIGMEAMLYILQLVQPKRILEIGTAIGYSAIRMAQALPNTSVVTIERDAERYDKALFYIERTKLQERIHAVLGDALEVRSEIERYAPFDAIFIDAAKGQYQRFFDLYSPLLNDGGVMMTDNVLFKGLVASNEPIENKRIRPLVEKIRQYNEWLIGREDYDTIILPIGDGIAISRKRGERA